MKTNKFILLIACLFISIHSFAHNIWIETAAKGKSGQQHVARIFLGGYGENERDSTHKWFSNTAEAEVWLTAPDGVQRVLEKSPDGNCFKINFTPTTDGIYILSVKHEVADIFGTTKYIYYAGAKVQVGSSAVGKEWSSFSDFAIESAVKGKVIKAKALFKKQLAAQSTMAIGASSGWSRPIETQSGEGSVEAIWKGLYVLEASYREKSEGVHNGKEYKTIMHIATFDTEVYK